MPRFEEAIKSMIKNMLPQSPILGRILEIDSDLNTASVVYNNPAGAGVITVEGLSLPRNPGIRFPDPKPGWFVLLSFKLGHKDGPEITEVYPRPDQYTEDINNPETGFLGLIGIDWHSSILDACKGLNY